MKVISFVAVVCLTVGIGAGELTLTDSEIETALAAGAKGKNKHHGLVLRDSGQSWAAALTTGGSGATASSGFWLEAFTPLSWIQQQSASAAKEYRKLLLADVGDELRESVFRVAAYPDTPNTVSAGGMTGTSSVQHVVIRDEARTMAIQPIWKEAFAETSKNAMGASFDFTGQNVKFSLDSLREIRGPKGDKEFFITVIGESGEEKNFKVKRKHFDELK